ncbi:uncharacterized protein LOC130712350 [Lotus japonicus]|uniref:uncharacterized protein LOC130712350 n=1 Tax=Lotus japonicus TaxID=34305 RepID=UPI002586F2A5|nr:uncharacterized protein LOC130712350 [Lotus japonicus]
MSAEKQQIIKSQTLELLHAGIAREIKYTTWLSNVVLVKKSSGKWRMCVDYTDLNKACPKGPFPLPCIDALVDNSSGYEYLSLMDAYSGYNQIPMFQKDEDKTTFVTDQGTYCYTMLPFGLKNVVATYQRMMTKIFGHLMGKSVEVYIDDVIVKTPKGGDHVADLAEVFEQLHKHNMRLNPEKCTFGVRSGKFLGYMLTDQGIELNPDKCEAIKNMKSPRTVKEVQQLAGRMAALGRFLPKGALRALPFYALLRKGANFEWTEEAETTFDQLKEALSSPPVLSSPKPGDNLYLYLAVRENAISSVLVREEAGLQQPVYFVSRALKSAEIRYQMLEKVALTLLTTACRLRRYFQAHNVTVRTNQPIRQVLHKPDLAGRMVGWSIELSEHDIRYEPRHSIKAQVLADFVVEMTDEECPPPEVTWTVHADGSSNKKGGGAGIVFQSNTGMIVEQSLRFNFPVTNNQAEYEACIAGLLTAQNLGAKNILVCCDSLLIVTQANGEAQTRDPTLELYLARLKLLAAAFDSVEFRHVPRAQNERADILAKLASAAKPGLNKTVIQGTLTQPSIGTPLGIHLNLILQILSTEDWMTPIIKHVSIGWLPKDKKEAKKLVRCSAWYSLINGTLFKRGYSTPLLKCLSREKADYVLAEIHEGSCGHHPGGRSLARKTLRAGYFWPTLEKDAIKHVKQRGSCQRHADLHKAPPEKLSGLICPWPFHQWGMDLLGPFNNSQGKLRFLIVAVDYFTKWIEAEPLATISSAKIQRFFYKNVISRFGVPRVLVTDNGKGRRSFSCLCLFEEMSFIIVQNITACKEQL